MIEVKFDEQEICISEVLSWEHHVLPRFEEMKENLKDWFENEASPDDDSYEGVKEFLNTELTKEDINEILINIKEIYEPESSYEDYVSIFDERIIDKAIAYFIEKFDIDDRLLGI